MSDTFSGRGGGISEQFGLGLVERLTCSPFSFPPCPVYQNVVPSSSSSL